MSAKVFFISDLHYGHKNMALHRGFESVEQHDERIINSWNAVVKKCDTVWILGDLTMERATYEFLDNLKGYKKVVLGNHDQPQHVKKMLEHVNSVCGMINYGKYILTHCPVHPRELEFRYTHNIHGHVHENTLPDDRYINVSCEVINYTPITIEQMDIRL